ncbi:MAG: hypothetical protein JWL98_328 [Xanthomonadaceae bacterium]|nr:hypothetical protein [Xanthomonadaceae bacterium]
MGNGGGFMHTCPDPAAIRLKEGVFRAVIHQSHR